MYIRIKKGNIKMYRIKKTICLESGKFRLSIKPKIKYRTNPNKIPALILGREALKR